MSRVGKKPVSLPKGVEAKVGAGTFSAKGPKGRLEVALVEGIGVQVGDDGVVVERRNEDKHTRALHGTIRSLVQNAVTGVADGFVKKLEIQGVGYRAQLQGRKLVLNVGYCHPIEVQAPEGVDFKCPDQTHIEVSGIDKQLVGQVAAQVRAARRPEPYKGKGIRYEGEQVRRKAGKAGK